MRSTIQWAAVLFMGVCAAIVLADAPVEKDLVGPPVPLDLKPERLDLFGDPLPNGALARFGTLRWRHSTPVFFLNYLNEDKEVLTVSQDGTIRVWDVDSGKEIRRFGKGNGAAQPGATITVGNGAAVAMVLQAQFFSGATLSADRKSLATSGQDGTIRVWDIAAGVERHAWKPNPQIYIGGMIFSPDGKSLAVKSNDQSLRLYNIEDGKEIRKLGAQPDARRRVFFGGNPGSSMAFTPDGKVILSGAMEFENNQVTAVIKRYDVETGKEVGTIKGPQGGFQSLALAPDGNTVAWGGNDGILRVWDLVKDKELHQMGAQNGGYANAITFSPNGKTLVTRSYDQVIRVWDATTGKEVRQLGGQEIQNANGFVVRAFGNAVSNLAFSCDGKHLAAGTTGNTVRQWQVESGKELTQRAGHHGPVVTLGVTIDGKTVISRAGDNTVHVWDVASSKEIRSYGLPENVMHVFLSADARIMVLGDYQGTIRTWDALTGKQIKEWKIGQNQNPAFGGFVGLASLAISPDGKTVAVRAYDQSIRLYDSASGRERKTMAEAPVANANGAIAVAFVNYGAPGPMAFSPDGSLLASLSNGGQQFIGRGKAVAAMHSSIQLWDVATSKPLRKIDPGNRGIGCMTFAPDGRAVASGNFDGTISLWEVASGKERLNFKGGAQAGIAVLAYAADGKTLLASGTDNVVRLFCANSGKEMSHVQGHEGGVVSLALAADNKTLVSGGVDTTALIYDISAMPRTDKQQPTDINTDRADALWKDLASEDAKKAYQAIQAFTNSRQAAQELQQRVKPIEAPDPKRVAQLIADLEGENPFAVRQRATEELEKLGELAADTLKKVLDDKPGLEMQMRVERLLERLVTGQAPPPERLRAHRALEILERVGSSDARIVMDEVSKGASGSRLTREAQESLQRMAR